MMKQFFENKAKQPFFWILSFLIFLVGIYFRTFHYLTNRSYWHDECSLAVNLITHNCYQLFLPLSHSQSAPPIFLFFSKLLFDLFPHNMELATRFIPFILSLFSIFLFFKLSTMVFQKKHTILVANFLFAVNYQLIYYSQEFKQYASDVFWVLLLILLFTKIDFPSLKKTNLICLSLFLAICPLLSLPSVFVILTFFILVILKKWFSLKFVVFTLPFVIINLFYYIFNLSPSKKLFLKVFPDFWADGLLNFNLLNIFSNLEHNFRYFFTPINLFFPTLILFILGIFYAIKSKNNVLKFIVGVIIVAYAFAFVNIYPMLTRVCLYILPLFLILILLPLDYISIKKKKFTIFILFLIYLFVKVYTTNYLVVINNKNTFIRENAKDIIQHLIKNYNPEDIFVYNDSSDSEFMVYTYIYNFSPKKICRINLAYPGEDWYPSILDKLPNNSSYVFYYPFDYAKRPVIPYLKQWIRDNCIIIDELELNKSYYAKVIRK